LLPKLSSRKLTRYIMNNSSLKLYGIFYDQETSKSIPKGMTPLDNINGPSWLFEAHPIHHYLSQSQPKDDEWLGFFSPKFAKKTNLSVSDIKGMFNKKCKNSDACLFSSYFDQAAISLNVWLQGDALHPGLLAISQQLANLSGYEIDLKTRINSLNQTVFSHYLIANGKFWREWHRVVTIYFSMVKSNSKLFQKLTPHPGELIPIHAFVIERIPSLILNSGALMSTFDFALYTKQFPGYSLKNVILKEIDHCKKMFSNTGNTVWLSRYQKQLRRYQNIM